MLSFNDFKGNNSIKEFFRKQIYYSNNTKNIADHILLHGLPGTGKTTLADTLAAELGTKIHKIHGANVRNIKDIENTIIDIQKLNVLFIDEIHALPLKVQESLYTIFDNFIFFTYFGKTKIDFALEPFTIIGATTNVHEVSKPLISRFKHIYKMESYTQDELIEICRKIAENEKFEIDYNIAKLIVERCQNNPRMVKNITQLVVHLIYSNGKADLEKETVINCFKILKIDENGMNADQQLILKTLAKAEKAVGLNYLSALTGIPEKTIQIVYEPLLVELGFIARTRNGRVATEKCDLYKSKLNCF
jgi:Holliday junction DNA helicase RuvB